MLERLISLIAPHLCIGCGLEGDLVCEACGMEGFSPLPARCYKCCRLTQDSRMCTRCRSPLAHVWVRTAYEGLARDLIHTMKFGRARAASRPISDLMLEALPYGLSVDTWVVPVPTASARVRQRGYDHAALLAKRVAGQRGFTFNNSLRRLGNARQVGATRQKRQTQLEGAFYCPRPEVVQGRNILLVDDIVTTGASIAQAAKILRQAGARSVSALIFAQKQ